MKQCAGCLLPQEESFFTKDATKKDTLCSYCKACAKKRAHLYYEKNKNRVKKNIKSWQANNKDKYKKKKIAWNEQNKDKITRCKKEWTSLNKDKVKAIKKKYYLTNKESINKRRSFLYKERRAKDPLFVIIDAARSRTHKAIKFLQRKGFGIDKEGVGHIEDYLLCSKAEYGLYLTSLFKEGMSFENYGCKTGQWSIDHTIPLSSAKTEKDLLRLLHYTNTKPMWHCDNVSKNDRIIGEPT